MTKIQQLHWDSTFFGYNIGKCTIENASNFDFNALKNNLLVDNYDLVYAFSKERLTRHYESPINTKVGFGMPINNDLEVDFSDKVQVFKDQEIPLILKDLAYQAGHFSRFYLDKKFPNSAFYRLYDQWLQNSLRKDVILLVYLYEKTIAGMMTLETKAHKTQIGLIGVDSKYRGAGIGKDLIKAGIYHSQHQQKTYLEVYTQEENVNACRFYESCGFDLISRDFIYHVWNNEEPPILQKK